MLLFYLVKNDWLHANVEKVKIIITFSNTSLKSSYKAKSFIIYAYAVGNV